MIRLSLHVILCLLVLCGPLWGQPDFRWPVDMSGVSNLTGNLGEPRGSANVHLDHWHKGIDIPKTNGETISIPADGRITYISQTDSSVVVMHHGIDDNPVGWHTRFTHVDFNSTLGLGDFLRAEGDNIPSLGTVTEGHCHMEVYHFNTEQLNQSFYGNVSNVRNPLNYANLTATYPDADNPTIEEIRFSLENAWNETSALETVEGQERFQEDVFTSGTVYFLTRAFDDITNTGATGPYSVVFSICMHQDCRWGKVSAFKYQFDDLRDADGMDLQLEAVYAEGTQSDDGMFYFSQRIELFSVPFNVNEQGFVISNPPIMEWLNTSGQWQTFRFQVDVLDNTCIDELDGCIDVSDSRCIDELRRENRCKTASRHKDISVPPDPDFSNPEIWIDSFSAAWQQDHVRIALDAFDSDRVNGFTILRRRSDEQLFAPLHPAPLTLSPTSMSGDDALLVPVRLSYKDDGLIAGSTYFYALEVEWSSGQRTMLDYLVEVRIPDHGQAIQQPSEELSP